MSKKLKLLLLGITVVIAGFFIFVLFMGEDDRVLVDLREKNTFEDPENYQFEELEEKMLVINDNLGISFEVPKEWEVDYYEEDGEELGYAEDPKGIVFRSPDYQIDENKEIEKGCEIGITVLDYKNDNNFNDWDKLNNDILEYKEGERIDSNWKKIIKIGDYYGMGYSLDATTEDWKEDGEEYGKMIIQILGENKTIYSIGVIFPLSNIEKCKEHLYLLAESLIKYE
jgi:hypothetical protein